MLWIMRIQARLLAEASTRDTGTESSAQRVLRSARGTEPRRSSDVWLCLVALGADLDGLDLLVLAVVGVESNLDLDVLVTVEDVLVVAVEGAPVGPPPGLLVLPAPVDVVVELLEALELAAAGLVLGGADAELDLRVVVPVEAALLPVLELDPEGVVAVVVLAVEDVNVVLDLHDGGLPLAGAAGAVSRNLAVLVEALEAAPGLHALDLVEVVGASHNLVVLAGSLGGPALALAGALLEVVSAEVVGALVLDAVVDDLEELDAGDVAAVVGVELAVVVVLVLLPGLGLGVELVLGALVGALLVLEGALGGVAGLVGGVRARGAGAVVGAAVLVLALDLAAGGALAEVAGVGGGAADLALLDAVALAVALVGGVVGAVHLGGLSVVAGKEPVAELDTTVAAELGGGVGGGPGGLGSGGVGVALVVLAGAGVLLLVGLLGGGLGGGGSGVAEVRVALAVVLEEVGAALAAVGLLDDLAGPGLGALLVVALAVGGPGGHDAVDGALGGSAVELGLDEVGALAAVLGEGDDPPLQDLAGPGLPGVVGTAHLRVAGPVAGH